MILSLLKVLGQTLLKTVAPQLGVMLGKKIIKFLSSMGLRKKSLKLESIQFGRARGSQGGVGNVQQVSHRAPVYGLIVSGGVEKGEYPATQAQDGLVGKPRLSGDVLRSSPEFSHFPV